MTYKPSYMVPPEQPEPPDVGLAGWLLFDFLRLLKCHWDACTSEAHSQEMHRYLHEAMKPLLKECGLPDRIQFPRAKGVGPHDRMRQEIKRLIDDIGIFGARDF